MVAQYQRLFKELCRFQKQFKKIRDKEPHLLLEITIFVISRPDMRDLLCRCHWWITE